MQLELGPRTAPQPRILALNLPELPLERALRTMGDDLPFLGSFRPPVALVEDGKVVLCDPAARAAGVRPGESAVQAQAACDRLILLPFEPAADRAALEAIAEAMLALSPRVEVNPPDVLLVDASPARLLGHPGRPESEIALAERARALAAGLGHRCLAVVADGRRPARALARHADRPVARVAPGETAAALARLPVSALDLDTAVEDLLQSMGIRDLGSLAALPSKGLAHRFGRGAVEASRLARGEDGSQLSPYLPQKLPEEAFDFSGLDSGLIESAEPLLFAVKRLADRLAARLAGRVLGATRLEIGLRLDRAMVEAHESAAGDSASGPPAGGEAHEPAAGGSASGPTAVGEEELGKKADREVRLSVALARPTGSAAAWLVPLKERVSGVSLPAPVVGLRLSVAEATELQPEQLAIGDRPEVLAALESVLARLAARLGEGAVFAAVPEDRYRPEAAYRARAFLAAGGSASGPPAAGEVKRERGKNGKKKIDRRKRAQADRDADAPEPNDRGEAAVRPTRLLAEPLPLVAEGEGGRLTAIRFEGRAYEVLSLAGPERLRGEWWSEPFDRDYFRAELDRLGNCWIFRNGRDGRLYLHGFFD